ncbi:MAG TPA: signal peptidase I [Acidobacteriaceae bacterium]|nr:signal peptidase I [Acidobacteriaceae bacterium]
MSLETGQPPAQAAADSHRRPHGHPHLIFPNILDTFRSLLSMIVIALFILTFVAQPFRIPSESMERTLLVGDFLLVNKSIFGPPGHWSWLLPYSPVRRGDVIVFHFPLDPADHVVKRVVGVPGDRVALHNGVVYLNGKKQSEPFTVFEGTYADNFRDQFPSANDTDPGVDTRWWMEMRNEVRNGQLQVPANSYFVLGDNRNYSRDSRYWGFVRPINIVGRPFLIYFSLHEPSTTDAVMLPDDRLGHEKSPLDTVVDFARWSRMFRVVR